MNKSQFKTKRIILYDGVCNLCNRWVRYILKRDKERKFHFCHQQSAVGKSIIKHMPDKIKSKETIIFMDEGKLYAESDAVLMIFRRLGGKYNFLFALIIIPHFIRNFTYRIVAKNRYKWFGKKEHCLIPNDQYRSRFID